MNADISNNFWLPDISQNLFSNGKIATDGFHDNTSMHVVGFGRPYLLLNLFHLILLINSYEFYNIVAILWL